MLRRPETGLAVDGKETSVLMLAQAFIGGIDLCFGRYDNERHKLTDATHLRTTWPGKDYYNPG